MRKWLIRVYNHASLEKKIRYSYLLILIPLMALFILCLYNLWEGTRRYDDMINSVAVASGFSLDFKNDFDYETYLLIVENKTPKESRLGELLNEALRIVEELEDLTDSKDNTARLESTKKYLNNLSIYKKRIEENLLLGNRYEENIKIWENDIQIVTALLRENIFQYIYYEICDIQQARIGYQEFYIRIIQLIVIAFFVIAVLILFLSYSIPRSITQPIRELSEVTDQVAKGNLSIRTHIHGDAEIDGLSQSLNTMIDKINELIIQVTGEQIRLRKAEFELLQAQINPHFLYNTLDAIIWLTEGGDQKLVVHMVKSLSDFFRTSLNQGKDIITIREELQHVRSYLEIQQIRYQDILKYEIDVPPELFDYRIPKITIQPIVENALYHGIKNKRGSGIITIFGNLMQKNCFQLVVKDTGIGMTKERLLQVREGICNSTAKETDVYGLYNVNERIRLNFGEQYGITINSIAKEGTTVSILLPSSID